MTCRDTPPPWTAAASFGPYAGALRDLVLLLKQGRRDELVAPLAGLLEKAFQSASWPLPAAIVGVPMHWWRRWRRGFNQAELLARELAVRLGIPVWAPLRRRTGATQVGQARSGRLRLSARGFAVTRPVKGSVVLVDDVLTTGATAAACTRALRSAGATEVRVLTLARTPAPGSFA
ncbi:MAG: ComF family protein [Thermoanaerobaculaceae bacterium]|mgnify:FL=1|nr:ComF family protein [Thermoanaerobaculaceae bacterium]MDI9620851.1 phosphoribosyltransferase family protein [Acidobacteriota bacterium]NLH11656.1 ComF family protein [Holophagae bacterium]HPW54719.1 phosphoribosyltransferase family protein [Thermoanaerobaculaceae bacterium]